MKQVTIGPEPKTATIFPEIYATEAIRKAFLV
jgi:hypothetical protein